jgi:beta-galactosidase
MNSFGKGKAVYIGADLTRVGLARVLRSLSASAGVKQRFEVPSGVELTVRKSANKQWVFLLNHTADPQSVSIPGAFTDLLTGEAQNAKVDLSGYGVRVLQAT